MALETGTYIDSLVATNPTSSDAKSQGDDHLRLLKSTIKATFPNVAGAVTATHTQLSYVTGVTAAIQTQLDTVTTNVTKATLTNGTAQASTSGTSIDFTSIPSWVKRITISFAGVSTNGVSPPIVQIGDSGGVRTSGYLGAGEGTQNGVVSSITNFTDGFGIFLFPGANLFHGALTLTLLDASTNTWACSGSVALSNGPNMLKTAGTKSLSATLDRVRITTQGGVDTFDAGLVNIQFD